MVILETRSSTWEARRPRDPRGKIGGPESDFGGPSRREKGTPKKWAKAYIYIWFGALFEVAKIPPKMGMVSFRGELSAGLWPLIKQLNKERRIFSGRNLGPNTP